MRQALSRRKWSFRAPSLALAVATLATCGFVGSYPISPALSQTPGPISLSLFDPDLADVRPGGLDQIKNATSCYPTATFSAEVQPSGDALMDDSLVAARLEALAAAFKKLDPDHPGRFKLESRPPGRDDVVVSYPHGANDEGKDGPNLKTTFVPKKGKRVKAGDTITVTIIASERFEDGHKSWPNGVHSIQLREREGGLVPDSGPPDYTQNPPACDTQSKTIPYLVPSPAPAVVQLQVFVDDGAGNQSVELANFPTGDWYGTWSQELIQTIHNDERVYDYRSTFDQGYFTFNVNANGVITGAGMGTFEVHFTDQVSAELSASSRGDLPSTKSPMTVAGHQVGGNFQLEFRQSAAGPPMPVKIVSTLKDGRSVTSAIEPFKNAIYRATLTAADGAHSDPVYTPDTEVITSHVLLHRAN